MNIYHTAIENLSDPIGYLLDFTNPYYTAVVQEGVRLAGFKYQKGYDWLDLNSKQEGVGLVGFKYQKGYDCHDILTLQRTIGLVLAHSSQTSSNTCYW
jgi:hypothetical protein